MDCSEVNLSLVFQDLAKLKINSKYQKKITYSILELEFSHHFLNDDILKKIAELVETKDFFTTKAKWARGITTSLMPTYTFLRLFDSNLPEFEEVLAMRAHIKEITEKVNAGKWLGVTQQPITDIINIGMGGSDLGPKFCYDALKSFQINPHLNFHFISDADYYSLRDCLVNLNPETSLFIVSSKSFTTEETMMNADIIREWIGHADALAHQFIAVTAYPEKAKSLGYKHIVTIPKWVIGRYSSMSAINLINSIALGYDHYFDMLKGANDLDQHFLHASWQENLPILLAFIGIWNINILKIPTHLLLIYHSKLRYFCDYVQQLDMESNGKSFSREGQKIDYPTAPIVWGGLGNPSQHSYYQLLAQGGYQVAMDFISVEDSKNAYLGNLSLQRKNSLYHGIFCEEQSFSIQQQCSINHLHLSEVTPRSIGALIALYEHKIFTQAWIWDINPFDQPGVESAKHINMN